jgi:hypothetical protein
LRSSYYLFVLSRGDAPLGYRIELALEMNLFEMLFQWMPDVETVIRHLGWFRDLRRRPAALDAP